VQLILEKFSNETNSPFARNRALMTAAHLKNEYFGQSREKREWLNDLRSYPTSIFNFKEALNGYDNDGFGPKGLQLPLTLDARFPNTGYAELFRRVLVYDELLQKQILDPVHDNDVDVIEGSGLVSYFQGSFGKEQVAGLEELSKFLLRRGKTRLFNVDISTSAGAIEAGHIVFR